MNDHSSTRRSPQLRVLVKFNLLVGRSVSSLDHPSLLGVETGSVWGLGLPDLCEGGRHPWREGTFRPSSYDWVKVVFSFSSVGSGPLKRVVSSRKSINESKFNKNSVFLFNHGLSRRTSPLTSSGGERGRTHSSDHFRPECRKRTSATKERTARKFY